MRRVILLSEGWKFFRTDLNTEKMPGLAEPGWQEVRVPHDWAIDGAFSPENDPQPLENSVLDYHENMIQIGRTGGLPFIGTGWYILKLSIPEGYAHYEIEFDGIMNHSEIYFNGHKIGERAFGYSSFCVNLTPFIRNDGENILVVRVHSRDKTSRWYPGAGIIRPVRLVAKKEIYFAYQGIWVKPQCDLKNHTAKIEIQCDVRTEKNIPQEGYCVIHRIFSPDGQQVLCLEGDLTQGLLEAPVLWELDSPALYMVNSRIECNGRILDQVNTRFGIRCAEFSRENGFSLNGKNIKIQGVCMHHDNGMLGAAYEESVVRFRLRSLKELGCNAVRTTHNPPCPRTLELCDELGILVLDEAFDEWTIPKAANGYANDFPKWAKRDLEDMIRRDRNHPSVILYSIGNEIPDQVLPEGRETCRMLTEICHRTDPSRPVTCGFNRPAAAIENGLTEEVDVVGMNYCAGDYQRYRREHPHWKMIATETMSAVSSRGEFYLPAQVEMPVVKRKTLQVNSFGLSAAACAYIPDVEFEAQRKAPYVAGQFVWAGYDYLGEPTPYREEWPSRSSFFGIFDLAGLKKDWYYLFASEWGKKPVVHLLPHWNWNEGELVDVFCFTNTDFVELYLNGKRIAAQQRSGSRVSFGRIPFEAGEIKAMGYRYVNGRKDLVCQDLVRTAGEPAGIYLHAAAEHICHPGEILYVEADIVDKEGTLCPESALKLDIVVDGAGVYAGSDAGDSTCLRPFREPWCQAFHGKLMIAVRAGKDQGEIFVHVKERQNKLMPAVLLLHNR